MGSRGKTGGPCKYLHPKKCRFHCTYGSNSDRNCRNGNNCTFLHPVLCPSSVQHYTCFNRKCNLTHLKGTKRYPQQSEQSWNTSQHRPYPTEKQIPPQTQPNQGQTNDFLAKIVGQVKKELLGEISEIKAQLNMALPTKNMIPPNMPTNYIPRNYPIQPQLAQNQIPTTLQPLQNQLPTTTYKPLPMQQNTYQLPIPNYHQLPLKNYL